MKAVFEIVGIHERAPKVEVSKSGGKKYCRVNLTVETEFKGESKKSWFVIMLWDKMAEDFVAKIKEGDEVSVKGTIYIKMMIDASQHKQPVPVLNAESFEKVSKKGKKTPEPEEYSDEESSPDFDDMMSEEKDKNK